MRSRLIASIVLTFLISHSVIAERAEKASGELRVRITAKNLPTPPLFNVNVDSQPCGKSRISGGGQITHEGFLRNAVVWLEPAAGTRAPAPMENTEVEPQIVIRNCEFYPRVLLTSPEQMIHFKSEDPILFQVRMQGQKNSKVVKPLPPNLEQVQFRVRSPEIIPISCDLHSWMKAFVVVASHSLYNISNDQGQVQFSKLERGEYSLHIWHELLGQKKWPEQISIPTKKSELQITWDYLDTDIVSAE